MSEPRIFSIDMPCCSLYLSYRDASLLLHALEAELCNPELFPKEDVDRMRAMRDTIRQHRAEVTEVR